MIYLDDFDSSGDGITPQKVTGFKSLYFDPFKWYVVTFFDSGYTFFILLQEGDQELVFVCSRNLCRSRILQWDRSKF